MIKCMVCEEYDQSWFEIWCTEDHGIGFGTQILLSSVCVGEDFEWSHFVEEVNKKIEKHNKVHHHGR